jgi:hypothetical protein
MFAAKHVAVFVGLVTAFAACCVQSVLATPITIENPGFENPGGLYFVPTGWTCSSGCTGYPNDLAGQLLPRYGSYAAHTEALGGFTQVAAGYTIQPNTRYTLEVLVGGRVDSSHFGFGGSRIELYDTTAAAILAFDEWHRATPGRPNGGYVTSTASFASNDMGGSIGHQLQVRLWGLQETGGGSPQTWFDNVSLDASPVPEPSTIALLGIGAINLLACAWRHRRS